MDWREVYKTGIKIGLSVEGIDNLTLNELNLYIEAYGENNNQKYENDLNAQIVGAYYTEIFKRQDKNKKLPYIKKFLIKLNEDKPKSIDNNLLMLERVKMLNTLFGGELIIKEGG